MKHSSILLIISLLMLLIAIIIPVLVILKMTIVLIAGFVFGSVVTAILDDDINGYT